MSHKEVWVKVNARCDEGIAALVAAMNEIHGVETVASCEDCYPFGAYIFFERGANLQELAVFLNELSSQLSELQLPFRYSLSLEWRNYETPHGKPYAQIYTAPESTEGLASAIREIAPILNDRTTELVGDKECKGLHS